MTKVYCENEKCIYNRIGKEPYTGDRYCTKDEISLTGMGHLIGDHHDEYSCSGRKSTYNTIYEEELLDD